MPVEPISNFKNQVKAHLAAKEARDQKLTHLAVLQNILDTASKSSLPETYLSEYRRQVASASDDLKSGEAEYVELTKAVDLARRGLGAELQDAVRSAIETLQGYLVNVTLRDREGGQLVFEEAGQYLQVASELNDFIYEGTVESPPVAPQVLTATAPAELASTTNRSESFEGLPTPKSLGLPSEMSEYYSSAKNGYSLKDFGERYKNSLVALLEKAENDIEKMARYLAHYGLNAGQLTALMVDGLFRNAGIPLQTRKVALVSPGRIEYWGNSHITAARHYMENAIGLKILAEKCQSLFNGGFSVKRAPAGSISEYTLMLQGLNKERLSELFFRISRRLNIPAPAWKS